MSTGRFISEDPVKDGLNWYAYCGGNPVMFWDPSGFTTKEETEMYKNGELSPGAYAYLAYCTFNFYLDDNYNDKENNMWYQKAEDFRATGYTDTGDAEWNRKIALMDSRPSGRTITPDEHYNRNEFNLEFTWEELQILQERLPDEYKWDDGVLANEHQNHTINGPNKKYVSYDGYFELIYNGNNELQTKFNNPDDMGTFNYYSPNEEMFGHIAYDWAPYVESNKKNVRM